LPLPIPDDNNKDHYLNFDTIKNKQTCGSHHPSLKLMRTAQARTMQETINSKSISQSLKTVDSNNITKNMEDLNRNIFTSGNVQHTVKCIECEKPRCIYAVPVKGMNSWSHLKSIFQSILDEPGYEFCCGNALFGPMEGDQISHPSQLDIFCTKPTITCTSPIETTYYQVGCQQICAYCGSNDNLLSLIELNDYVDKYGKGQKG